MTLTFMMIVKTVTVHNVTDLTVKH